MIYEVSRELEERYREFIERCEREGEERDSIEKSYRLINHDGEGIEKEWLYKNRESLKRDDRDSALRMITAPAETMKAPEGLDCWEAEDGDKVPEDYQPGDDIACMTCKWRLPDLLMRNGGLVPQAKARACVMHRNKPAFVLMNTGECGSYAEYDWPKVMADREWKEKYRGHYFSE